LALGAPYVKYITMAGWSLTAAIAGKTIGRRIAEGQVRVYVDELGTTPKEVFITSSELKQKFGSEFAKIPTGALGLYTYMQRVSQGLKQMIAGSCKFSLEYINGDDITGLTK